MITLISEKDISFSRDNYPKVLQYVPRSVAAASGDTNEIVVKYASYGLAHKLISRIPLNVYYHGAWYAFGACDFDGLRTIYSLPNDDWDEDTAEETPVDVEGPHDLEQEQTVEEEPIMDTATLVEDAEEIPEPVEDDDVAEDPVIEDEIVEEDTVEYEEEEVVEDAVEETSVQYAKHVQANQNQQRNNHNYSKNNKYNKNKK